MITLLDIISDIKKIMMANNADSAERVNTRNLKHKIDKYRMDYIYKELQETGELTDEFIQTLKFTKLVQKKLGVGLTSEEIGVITGLHFADIDGEEVKRITGEDMRTQIDYVPQSYFYQLLSIKDDSLKNITYACKVDNELHVSGGANKTIIIQYLSTDPIADYILSGVTDKAAWETKKYPISGKGLAFVVISILTRDFNLQSRIVSDIIEDGKDQYKVMNYAKGNKALQADVFATPDVRGGE